MVDVDRGRRLGEFDGQGVIINYPSSLPISAAMDGSRESRRGDLVHMNTSAPFTFKIWNFLKSHIFMSPKIMALNI
jgi:hypothetical protein